ncbi:MAG TPA: hypothetical protein VFW66_05000 [Gemmatimonadales bacterium]|nr:hypothetical protein [Gemmatimonadales bacterium]
MARQMTRPAPVTSPKQALYDAVGDVMRHQAEERDAEQAAERVRRERGPISPVLGACLLVLVSVGAYVAVERPAWLFPPPVHVESHAELEASLRISIASAARRVERFRERHGRLPASLGEAGSDVSGVRFQPVDGGRYVLTGSNGDLSLTYQSTDSLGGFVGESFRTLAERVRR